MASIISRLAYADFVDDSTTTLTASTSATNLPATNLKDNFVAQTWRATGCTDENVVIDFGSAKTPTVVAALGHNFSSGATLTLQANATDSWGAPTYTQALTIVSDSLSDVIPKICYFPTLGASFRYMRIRIQDSANPDTYVEMGRLWMSTYFQPTYNFDAGFTVDIIKPDQVERPVIGGPYGRRLPSYEVVRFGWSGSGNPLPTSDRQTLEAIYRNVGLALPILFVHDVSNNPTTSCIYGFFENEKLTRAHAGVTDYGTEGLQIREDVGWNYV